MCQSCLCGATFRDEDAGHDSDGRPLCPRCGRPLYSYRWWYWLVAAGVVVAMGLATAAADRWLRGVG